MSNVIHLNIESVSAWNPITQLAEEAYSDQISIFDYRIGHHLPLWRHVKTGDKLIYSIDNITVCGGELIHFKPMALRPRWIPDNEQFNLFVDCTRAWCATTFDKKWSEFMKSQHIRAIEQLRWLFIVFAIVKPTYYYVNNKEILDDKVREVIAYEDQAAREASPFYMGEMIDE